MKNATEAYEVENMLKGMDFLNSLNQPELAEMISALSGLVIATANLDHRTGRIDTDRHASLVERAKALTPTHVMQ